MTDSIQGLAAVRELISCPTQWRLLLSLTAGPQTLSTLWRQLPRRARWSSLRALNHLWRHKLIVFHMKQWTWELSPFGESLRPVLTAILRCPTN